MDLLQTVRKEGSRGGRADFKWEDVKNDAQRENYLGHSLMAPVGRWQQGKDLNWYAKGDGTEEGELTAAEKRKEEIRKIKEAEEEARCIALGLPPPDKNANLIPLGDGKNKMEESTAVATEDKEKKKKRRHRSRSRDRNEKRHRHRRHRSTSREEGHRHRRYRSPSREDEGRKRRRSSSRDRERVVRASKDRSRSRDARRDGHRRRRDDDERSSSPYKASKTLSRRYERSRSPYKEVRRSRYRNDRSFSPDSRRKRRNKRSLDTIDSSNGKPNKIEKLQQDIAFKKKEIAALLQEHTRKELALGQEMMDRMKDNEALRNDLNLSTRVINSLNEQVDGLLDWNWDVEVQQVKKPRAHWGLPIKAPGGNVR